jgi:uncharacterized protein YuzE
MGAKLTFKYDRKGDILYIDKRAPYPQQESEELGDEVIARLNPQTGEIENLEVLFFSTRLLRADLFELPVRADLHIAVPPRKSGSRSAGQGVIPARSQAGARERVMPDSKRSHRHKARR